MSFPASHSGRSAAGNRWAGNWLILYTSGGGEKKNSALTTNRTLFIQPTICHFNI
jgi:hypothetical protein